MAYPTLRGALIVWLAILVAIFGRLLIAKRSNSVYPIFATAGSDWLAGDAVYRPPTQDLDQFRYSPTVAAAFAPWSLLPQQIGEMLWRVVNAAVFLAGLAYWARWWRSDVPLGMMILLVIPLAVGGLNNGQCNALIAGFLLLAQVWFARSHWWMAAAAVAACVLIKEYPLALGLLFALLEPRRFAPRLAICLAIGLAIPYLLHSPEYVTDQYRAWFARVAADDRTTNLSLSYRDLHLLLKVIGLPLTLVQYRALEVGLACAAAATIWIHRNRWDVRQSAWACGALATCWMTFAGPATESCTYVLAAPLLAACVLESKNRARWQSIAAAASFALFTFAAMIVWFPRAIAGPVHEWGVQPFAGLLLTVVAISLCGRRQEQNSVPRRVDDLTRPQTELAA